MSVMNKLIAKNPNARHNYTIEDTIEAGIVLSGTEIKSVREGKVNLKDSYAGIKNGEVFIYSMHISPYEKGNIFNKDPLRVKRLLLHKAEIRKLDQQKMTAGYTLVPLEVYFKNGRVKVEIGLARGKKLYDKRADMAKKDQQREAMRDFRQSFK